MPLYGELAGFHVLLLACGFARGAAVGTEKVARRTGTLRGLRGPAAQEADRLAALRRYAILDTPQEAPFERVVALARDALRTPAAIVSLVDATRQWFKARAGIEAWETPREWSFCDHAIGTGTADVLVVPDASLDPRFAANPLVTGPPHIRFYAGAPLRTADGHGLGTLAVVSPDARPQGITAVEARTLRGLADIVMDGFDLRLRTREALEAAERATAALAAEMRLRRAQQAAGVVAFELGAEGLTDDGQALRALHGLSPEGPLGFDILLAGVHPDDRHACRAARARAVRLGGSFLHEYRVLLPDGRIRWLEARGTMLGVGGAADPAARRAAGIVQDVTSRHQAEQERALLAREVDHRAKNILAVVQAALRLTPRDDPRAYAEAVEGRIGALARTHALLARERWTRAGLREIVETELLGFLHGQRGASDGPRARLRGPALLLGPDAAQPLAMAIHELATNATKYGALALSGGHLAVSWTLENRGGMLVLRWVERGGPPLESPPARRGFGSRVLETTVRTQLGGTLTLDWAREGLTCEIRVPTARLLAS